MAGASGSLLEARFPFSSAMRANDARLVAVGRVDAHCPSFLRRYHVRSLIPSSSQGLRARSVLPSSPSRGRPPRPVLAGGAASAGLTSTTRLVFAGGQLSHIARKAESSADDPTSASADFALPNSHGRDMAENWQSSRALRLAVIRASSVIGPAVGAGVLVGHALTVWGKIPGCRRIVAIINLCQ